MNKGNWLTIEEAAEMAGVHWLTIRRAIKKGQIAAGIGPKPIKVNVMLCLRSDVERWVRSPRGLPSKIRTGEERKTRKEAEGD